MGKIPAGHQALSAYGTEAEYQILQVQARILLHPKSETVSAAPICISSKIEMTETPYMVLGAWFTF